MSTDNNGFQPPNFDRIHSFLEERLGTRDVSARFCHVEGNKLVVYSNEKVGFWFSNKDVWKFEKNLLNNYKSFLVYAGGLGPRTINGSYISRNRTGRVLRDYNYQDLPFMKAKRSFAFSFSVDFIKSYFTDVTEDIDIISAPSESMLHEMVHGAYARVNRFQNGPVTNLTWLIENEAVAMSETLDFARLSKSNFSQIYLDYLIKASCETNDEDYHVAAARLVLDGDKRIETARQAVYDANKRLVK